jgi:anthranilate synthase/aminodeoxychorismate synthase-like glutamine amidotransferase
MILLLDNYDSFTHNLAHILQSTGREVVVTRNDAIGTDEVSAMRPEGIVISPGPGRPEGAGITVELIRRLGASVPILGVCLGHQAIGQAYGATVVRQTECAHGIASPVIHDGCSIFTGVANPFEAGRYHSLVISPQSLPGCLRVTAMTADGTIMAIEHSSHPATGVQFHPESILTPDGALIIRNWIASL